MKVLVAGISAEIQHLPGMLALHNLKTREGDDGIIRSGTRGDYSRGEAVDELLNNEEFDALLFLDMDHRHPRGLLEKLRKHDLPIVTAHYFRREFNPMLSVCSELSPDGTWPFPPLLDIPREGLHKVAVTGFGAVLIKREVIEAVKDMLPEGDNPVGAGYLPNESGDHRTWGGDFRFFTLARRAGYDVWLDASVESPHACVVYLDRDLYDRLGDRHRHTEVLEAFSRKGLELHGMNEKTVKARIQLLEEKMAEVQRDAKELNKQKLEIEQKIQNLNKSYIAYKGALSELKNLLGPDTLNLGGVKIPAFKSEEEVNNWALQRSEEQKAAAESRLDAIHEANSSPEA